MGRTPPLPCPARVDRARAAVRSCAVGVLAVLLVALSLAAGPFASAATAEAISKKRQEATRLADAVDSLNAKIELLDEDELQAREKLAALRKRLRSTSSDVSSAQKRLASMQALALNEALHSYANPAAAGVDVVRGPSTLNELERRAIYQEQALARSRDVQDALRSARDDLTLRRARLDSDQRAADAAARVLARKRSQADALITRYEALQRSVQGDLATLVAEAERQRQAEEARQAKLALERKAEEARKQLAQLQAAAARAAARAAGTGRGTSSGRDTTTPTTPGSGKATKPTATTIASRSSLDLQKKLAIDAGLAAELPASPGGRAAVDAALSQLGKPYVWGAAGPSSYDCSGLMLYAWRAGGRSLPHSSRSQFASTTRVSVSQIKLGDLVFYGSPIHHVGMYIGGGQMVEASRRGKPVKTSSIFRRDLVGVGRVG